MKFPKIYIFDLAKSAKHKGRCWTDPVGFTLYSFLNLTYGYKNGKKTSSLPVVDGIYHYRFYDSNCHNKSITSRTSTILCDKSLKKWVVTGACLHGDPHKKGSFIALYVKRSK